MREQGPGHTERETSRMGMRGDHRAIVTVEELAISNSFEIAALIEVLESKGLLTKGEVLESISRLRAQPSSTPPAPR